MATCQIKPENKIMSMCEAHRWKEASVSLSIRLYKCPNRLPCTSMDDIMAWIYHDWIWLPKPQICSDISLFYLEIKIYHSCNSCRFLAYLSHHKYNIFHRPKSKNMMIFKISWPVFCTIYLLSLAVIKRFLTFITRNVHFR